MTALCIRRMAPVVPVPAAPPTIRSMILDRPYPNVRIFVTEAGLQQVWDTVDVSRSMLERGGALAGQYGTDSRGSRFVVITDALLAKNAPVGRSHIAIRPQDWLDIFDRLITLPGRRLLGWYHSHPALGLSMSRIDRETQRRVFNADWQVGLVVDPCLRRFRFYQGREARRARWVAITD